MDTNKWIGLAIGVFIVLTLLFALAPSMFTNAASLNTSDAPAWFSDNITTIVAIVLLLVILGAVGLYKKSK